MGVVWIRGRGLAAAQEKREENMSTLLGTVMILLFINEVMVLCSLWVCVCPNTARSHCSPTSAEPDLCCLFELTGQTTPD